MRRPLIAFVISTLVAAWVALPCAAQSGGDSPEFLRELAKTECQRLMNALVPFAEGRLRQQGEFYPYGGGLTAEGRIVNIGDPGGAEEPPSAEEVQDLEKSMAAGARAGSYIATGMVYSVRITLPGSGEESDAIAVALDHRNDYSVVILLPYRLQDGEVTFGETIAQKGAGRVFGPD